MTFLTDQQADAYSLFQTSRSFQMSKTNDHARAHRALHDVIRQGLPARHPTRVALQARLDRYTAHAALTALGYSRCADERFAVAA